MLRDGTISAMHIILHGFSVLGPNIFGTSKSVWVHVSYRAALPISLYRCLALFELSLTDFAIFQFLCTCIGLTFGWCFGLMENR